MHKIKLSKRIICAIIAVILSVVCGVFSVIGLISSHGKSLDEVKNGIVWVLEKVYDANGQLLAAESGTGWAIGKPGQPVEYIVTNGHVVQYAYQYPKEQPDKYAGTISVYFSAAENDAVQPQVVYYSPPEEKDLAILKLPTPTTKRIPLSIRPSSTVEPGNTAYALGYPGISSEREDYTKYDQSDITITKGIISKQTTVKGTDYKVFQMDVAIASGNSGGPLVDDNGYVLGINTLGAVKQLDSQTTIDLGMNYAIIGDELTKILDNERIPYTIKSDSTVLDIILLILAVILLAAAAVLIFMKPKQKTSAAPGGSPANAGKKPVLRGVTGKYAGQSFGLGTARITLGRDQARCNVVFDANAPGISSCHCSVYYDAGSDCFMLTDNGSSYGTFLGNGKKLTATVAEKLSAGDSFYLADPGNRFVVTKE